MSNGIALVVFAGLLAPLGGYSIWKGVRSVRARRNYPGALMYWAERPDLGFGRDPAGSLTVLLHRLALVLIGGVAIAAVLLRPEAEPASFPRAGLAGILISILELFAANTIGYTWGISFFGPLADRLGGDHHYAVSEEGILVGDNIIPWIAFSHFDLHADRNLIYIWSAFLRQEPAMVAAPQEPGTATALAAILREHLPASAPPLQASRGKWTLPTRMALLCLPFLAVVCLLTRAPLTIMLIADAVLMWVLQLSGAALIGRLLYGDTTRPTSVAPK